MDESTEPRAVRERLLAAPAAVEAALERRRKADEEFAAWLDEACEWERQAGLLAGAGLAAPPF